MRVSRGQVSHRALQRLSWGIYAEMSSETDSDSEASNGSMASGYAYDLYSDSDFGDITISGTVTTSLASFTLLDTHSIGGDETGSTANSTSSVYWSDSGGDEDILEATGTESTAGDSYSFVDTETSDDDYAFVELYYGSYDCTMGESLSGLTSMTGSTSNGVSGGTYSYLLSDSNFDSSSENGHTTETHAGMTGTLTETDPFAESNYSTDAYEYAISGASEHGDARVLFDGLRRRQCARPGPGPVDDAWTCRRRRLRSGPEPRLLPGAQRGA